MKKGDFGYFVEYLDRGGIKHIVKTPIKSVRKSFIDAKRQEDEYLLTAYFAGVEEWKPASEVYPSITDVLAVEKARELERLDVELEPKNIKIYDARFKDGKEVKK